MNIIKAKDFASRTDLDNEIKRLAISSTTNDYQIEGEREELERLQLNDLSQVYGVKCVITDLPAQTKRSFKKINRGKIHPYGLDGNLKKST